MFSYIYNVSFSITLSEGSLIFLFLIMINVGLFSLHHHLSFCANL